MSDREEILAMLESRRQEILTQVGICVEAKDYVGERLFMFAEGEIRSMIRKINALPPEQEAVRMWIRETPNNNMRLYDTEGLAMQYAVAGDLVYQVEIREVTQ